MVYDYLGRRAEQKLTWTVGTTETLLKTMRLVYDGWSIIGEMAVSTSTSNVTGMAQLYTWGLDITGTPDGAAGIGGLLIQDGGAGKRRLTGHDGFGNVNLLIDVETGARILFVEYDPHGKIVYWEGAGGADQHHASQDWLYTELPFRYQSKWSLDYGWPAGEAPWLPFQLYDFGMRWYNAESGRFINRDPIEEAGGSNLYQYVGNDPVGRWDLLGMSPNDPCYGAANCTAYSKESSGIFVSGLGWILEDSEKKNEENKKNQDSSQKGSNEKDRYDNKGESKSNENNRGSFFGFSIPDGNSSAGDLLRKVPLIGGLLGGVADVFSGVGNIVIGNFDIGINQIAYGIGSTTDILLRDAAAVMVGAIGTFVTTASDIYNVATFGTQPRRDLSGTPGAGEPTGIVGAIKQLAFNAIIPDYGLMGGANWGTTQFGPIGAYLNWVDLNSRTHDNSGYDRGWVIGNWSPPNFGEVAPGPVGIGYVVIGTIPFWVRNAEGY